MLMLGGEIVQLKAQPQYLSTQLYGGVAACRTGRQTELNLG